MECVMDHIVINMEDDDRMIRFYSEILMLAPERLDEYRAGRAPFPSVRISADTIIDLFPRKMWKQTAPAGPGRENLDHFCLSMPRQEWEALLKRLEAAGVEIEEGPARRWGALGMGTSVYFRDPERNLIEARRYE
ncbi:putative dioxygenase [Candidatus Desulfarcum epimagneticum]|uniref:Putative dioxygenase n=1 Tax=uncultured Desulfobacteraceae bacterium TaxID=218296 RepID=A0A484HKU6_9BACT|nr:putative dioxygenase [uncultured Desulfobacteraceae bacterium]